MVWCIVGMLRLVGIYIHTEVTERDVEIRIGVEVREREDRFLIGKWWCSGLDEFGFMDLDLHFVDRLVSGT